MKKYFVFLLLVAVIGVAFLGYTRGADFIPPLKETQESVSELDDKIANVWEVKAPLPTARTEITAAVLNGEVYVIGGFDGFGRTSTAVEVYNPKDNSWRRAPDLPEGRHHAAAAVVHNTLYLIGGYHGTTFSPRADVFEFDTETPVYNRTTPNQSPWKHVAPLPIARGALAAAVISDKIYVIGGVEESGLSGRLEVYNPAFNKWERLTDMPTPRDHLAAGVLNDKLYVAGGREQSLSKNLAVLEIYDPRTDTWTKGPELPTARGGVAGASFDDAFVIFGGEEPTKTFDETEAYFLTLERWVPLEPLPTPRHGLAAARVGDTIFVIGGGKQPGLSVSGVNEAIKP